MNAPIWHTNSDGSSLVPEPTREAAAVVKHRTDSWTSNCCGGRFTGLSTAHCTVCHETFTSPTGFDRHRRYGKCLDPARLWDNSGYRIFKLVDRPYRCWGGDDVRETHPPKWAS